MGDTRIQIYRTYRIQGYRIQEYRIQRSRGETWIQKNRIYRIQRPRGDTRIQRYRTYRIQRPKGIHEYRDTGHTDAGYIDT